MSSLLVRGQKGGVSVTPASAGWRYVSFNALRIPNGGRFELETEGSEACIVVIAGRCAVRIGEVGWPHVGERASPFDGPPHAIYAPPGVTVEVRDGDLVLVPRGYHTVSAAPGYELYYLNVMAGPVRRWCVTFDPEHEWLRR